LKLVRGAAILKEHMNMQEYTCAHRVGFHILDHAFNADIDLEAGALGYDQDLNGNKITIWGN
jgi:hypothetical protein